MPKLSQISLSSATVQKPEADAVSAEMRMRCVYTALNIFMDNIDSKASLEVGVLEFDQLEVITNAQRNLFLQANATPVVPPSNAAAASAASTANTTAASTAASAASSSASSTLQVQWFKRIIKRTRRKAPVDRLLLARCRDRWYAVSHYNPTGAQLVQVLDTSACYLRRLACTPNRRVYILVDPAYPVRAPLARMCARAEVQMFFAAFGQALALSGSKTLAVTVSRREKRK